MMWNGSIPSLWLPIQKGLSAGFCNRAGCEVSVVLAVAAGDSIHVCIHHYMYASWRFLHSDSMRAHVYKSMSSMIRFLGDKTNDQDTNYYGFTNMSQFKVRSGSGRSNDRLSFLMLYNCIICNTLTQKMSQCMQNMQPGGSDHST